MLWQAVLDALFLFARVYFSHLVKMDELFSICKCKFNAWGRRGKARQGFAGDMPLRLRLYGY